MSAVPSVRTDSGEALDILRRIEPVLTAQQRDIGEVKRDLGEVKRELADFKRQHQADIAGLREQNAEIRGKISLMPTTYQFMLGGLAMIGLVLATIIGLSRMLAPILQ